MDPSLENSLIEIRHHLHKNPELSFQEFETSAFIKQTLTNWGIPYKEIANTGVFVDIVGDQQGETIALRADIDALPIKEEFLSEFQSQNQGVMHACGHDGHTAILLGAVKTLYENRSLIKGTVRCIFQPGEEADGAALRLVNEGVLQNPNVKSIIGLHLWPHLPFGHIGIKKGNATAACDSFTICIKGKGGHSARPHQALDAIVIGTELIQHLNHVNIKKFNPLEPHVIHIGSIHAGEAANVVADELIMTGTSRSYSKDLRQRIDGEIKNICDSLAKMWNVQIDYQMKFGAPHIFNDYFLAEQLEKCARAFMADDEIDLLKEPSMGGDDFGYYADQIPALYFRLGIAKEDSGNLDLHHPKFNFDDQVLTRGAEVFSRLAVDLLNVYQQTENESTK
ncbi:M20 metallopeptidase family protein [Rummeliibacillus pycnus]|uniref:M20 metallopeptidase family protein n=1 Tax=Rummeliibacillus pycnus TaxID=101070 RepID=UPI003D269C14